MALVTQPHGAQTVKNPTQSLQNALTDFETTLTIDERQRFHGGAFKLEATSVLGFVSEIDLNNRTRSGQCVAQRLSTFLISMQQFTSTVDTFVSSNPTIAALLWGGVKMTILAASNITSFFDEVTSMIMKLGKTCPTLRQFGCLYPDSVELQEALCGYYAAVVKLCVKILHVSRRSGISQAFTSVFTPFEAEFKADIDKITDQSNSVRMQVSLASQKAAREAFELQQREAQHSSAHRDIARKFQKETKEEAQRAQEWRLRKTARETARTRAEILDRLSTFNHIKPWRQALRNRTASTAEWIFDEADFAKWRVPLLSNVLWCPGTMGVGKSILFSNIVAHLCKSQGTDEAVSWFFCGSEHGLAVSSVHLWGSIARQMLQQQVNEACGDDLARLHDRSQDFDDAKQILQTIIEHLREETTYYIIIDGLDEVEDSEQMQILSDLAALKNTTASTIKIALSGRPELERSLIQWLPAHIKIPLAANKTSGDIENMIVSVLSTRLDEGQLKISDPDLVLKISDALREKSDGMFLWTRLVIDEICLQNNDEEILRALELIPTDLNTILSRKLERIRSASTAKYALLMLEFAGVVYRPLRLAEYQELLSLAPEQTSLNRMRFPNDMLGIVNSSHGLCYVDEEDSTVHFVHHSVQHFLFHSAQDSFDVHDALGRMTHLCMVYLNFGNFQRQVTKTSATKKEVPFNALDIGLATLDHGSIIRRTAKKLLLNSHTLRRLDGPSLDKQTQTILGSQERDRLANETVQTEYQYFEYCRTHWLHHIAEYTQSSDSAVTPEHQPHTPSLWPLFVKTLCTIVKTYDERERIVAAKSLRKMKAYISCHDFYEIIDEIRPLDPELKDVFIREALTRAEFTYIQRPLMMLMFGRSTLAYAFFAAISAQELGFLAQIRQHLQTSDVVQPVSGSFCNDLELDNSDLMKAMHGRSAIGLAASMGSYDIWKVLNRGRNSVIKQMVSSPGSCEELMFAVAKGGSLQIIADLYQFRSSYRPKFFDTYWSHYRFLCLIAMQSSETLIKSVLHIMRGLKSLTMDWNDVLHWAAKHDIPVLIDQMIQTGFLSEEDLRTRYDSSTVLYRAVACGSSQTAMFLLNRHVDPNDGLLEANREASPLSVATERSDYNFVKLLLDHGADPHKTGVDMQPLLTAVLKNEPRIVRLLLAAEADPNYSTKGLTALHVALNEGHYECVVKLLFQGADANKFAYPLLQAQSTESYKGYERKFFAEWPDGVYPLHIAAARGMPKAVGRLIGKGADVHATIDSRPIPVKASGIARSHGHHEISEALFRLEEGKLFNRTDFGLSFAAGPPHRSLSQDDFTGDLSGMSSSLAEISDTSKKSCDVIG